MSLLDKYWGEPSRTDLRNIEHVNLHGKALETLEGQLGEFYDHFRTRLSDGGLLSRADVKPEELKPFLLNMVIFDLAFDQVDALEDVVVRLIGGDVEHFYGKLTGHSITAHPSKKAAERTFNSITKMLELRAPVLADTRGRLPEGNDVTIRTLYIPLAQDGQTIDQAVACVEIKKSELE
jgi:hypothetical protein